ncbi:hypothetical protein J2S46_003865 [Kitasatospora herbaricolor]|nr:hypothetical protein [Kitasatospora herbaricolor]MDQ0309309.1 hypothetical protein [Kitasatospora herbaricolor]
MSTLYRTAPHVIVHVPALSARSAERICCGLTTALIATTARAAPSGR